MAGRKRDTTCVIVCTDNLTGSSYAIEAVYPKSDIQNCIIHKLRNSSKYVSYKDLKELMADLKRVFTAVDEPSALDALDDFSGKWDRKYTRISKSWWDNRANLSSVSFQTRIHRNNSASSLRCGIIDAREMTRNRKKPCIWRAKCTSES